MHSCKAAPMPAPQEIQCRSIGDAGAQGWCGHAGCVPSGERVLGRNETIGVHVRNCLHTCNRTQVRSATNEEADGLEMVRNWIQELSEDVRCERLQHNADTIAEGDPDEDEMRPDESVPDVRHWRAHSQSELERTSILEWNVGERSNRSLIVPAPEEPRQHWRGEFDRKGTASEILGRPGS